MENLNPLYSYLPGSVPLIVGDRSLSTYGRRIFKGIRAQQSGWPLPGIYSPLDLAQNLLQKYFTLRAPLSDLSLFSRLLQERSTASVAEVFDDFVNARNLRKLMGYAEAARILADGELSEKSHGVVYTLLLLQKISGELEQAAHSFDLLEQACDLLETRPEAVPDFHVAVPGNELFLVGFRELYPLEFRFLNLLEKKYKIIRQLDAIQAPPAAYPQDSDDIQSRPVVLWASDLGMPGPLEASLLSGALQPVRLGVPSHLRYHSPSIERFKQSWIKNPETFIRGMQDLKMSPDDIGLLKRMHHERTRSAVQILETLGFFRRLEFPDDSLERKFPLARSPGSPLVLSMEELPLVNPGQALLWGKAEKLEEFVSGFCAGLNPLKHFKDLEKALLAEGVPIPRMEDEQRNFEKLFFHFAPALKLLKNSGAASWESGQAHEIKFKVENKMLSPSGLEGLNKCSLYFHFHREKRLSYLELEDDLAVSPLRRGNWIHYTLESLQWQDPKKITLLKVREALLKHVQKAFKQKASPAYLKIMEAQSEMMAESMYHYVKLIDLPLYEAFSQRQSKAEQEISSPWNKELTLRGRVDRLDFVGDGAFLWDYKSGNYSNSRFGKHLENGKFQWLLYREIFHKEGTPIHGGGYINPVDLKKSRLIFFHTSALQGSFYDRLTRNDIPFEILSAGEEEQLRETLLEKINGLVEIYNSGVRKASPREKTECDHCSYIGLCGYPYGVLP